jgi:hypothetical protein
MHGDESAIRFATREPEPVQRSMRRLAEVLRHDIASGVLPVVLCDNLGQLERLEELLPRDVLGEARLAVGALEGGFRMADAALAVYTDHEIFDRRRRVRRRRRYAAGVSVEHLTRIEPGDYLVHMDYGIGQYEGLERLKLTGEGDVEALKLRYADDEVLYVPVEQLARVEKFTSEDGRPPAIHRLGTGHWERQKAKTEAAIQKLADELLELPTVRVLVLGERRAVDVQLHVVTGERHGGDEDVEPLRRRVAAEREQPCSGTLARGCARELREVDPVPDRAQLPRRERERAALDARHRGREPLRRLQQIARAPVREPEDQRDPQRTDERSCEHGVDGAHVRDDSASAKTRKLARQRGLEARSAQRPSAGTEGADAAVLRQHAGDGAVSQDDDLVDEGRECGDLGDSRGERGMPGVDLLRDEEELSH